MKQYDIKQTLQKIKVLKGYPKPKKATKKSGFNANQFLQKCNRRRKLKTNNVKTVKELINLINFELES